MDAIRWGRVKELFGEALELPETERTAWLAAACSEDAAIRREVEQLLEAEAKAGSFLENPAVVEPDLEGRRFGPWRIQSEIGRGGMGAVYRAEREGAGFRQVAALKLLHGGLGIDGVPRFEQERRILARLHHPAIASLLDGGTAPEGEPWLAMEHVEGEPIDAYSSQHGLGLRERLELFRQACGAVAYAHRNLVVHRDLKPSNILVNPDGHLKLLDFGIARLLDPTNGAEGPTAALTATLLPALTPEYASPEQVRGEPVTTSSDVYSLGVVLFELLTGERPYRVGHSPGDMVRAVCETQPPRPSTVVSRQSAAGDTQHRPPRAPTGIKATQLAGDLDTIVLKALRKEPERRYASVAELDEDIQRYLAGLPVRARPDTFAYRSRKLIARNRAATVAAILALVSLAVGIAATMQQARVAERNRARAERRFAETRKLANTLLFDIHQEVARLPGSIKVREHIVTSAVEYLEELSKDAAGDTQLQLDLAAAWLQLGVLQGGLWNENLGQRDAAAHSYGKARELVESAARSSPRDPTVWLRLGDVRMRLGLLRMVSGEIAGGLTELEAAAASYDAGLELAPDEFELRRWRAGARIERALALGLSDRFPEGIEEARLGVTGLEALLRERPAEDELQSQLATALERLGMFEEEMIVGKRAGLESFRRSLALREALLAQSPDQTSALEVVLASHSQIADSLEAAGDLLEAIAAKDKALVIAERLAAADPDNVQARSDLAYLLVSRGRLLLRTGRPPEAISILARARQILEPLIAADAGHAQLRVRIAQLVLTEGRAWAAAADVEGGAPPAARQRAIDRLSEAQERWQQLDADGLIVGQDREELPAIAAELAALRKGA